jgi:hypothetical protein
VQRFNGARPSKLDAEVLALDVAELAQTDSQRLDARRRILVAAGAETQVSEAGYFRGLLGTGYQRPLERHG